MHTNVFLWLMVHSWPLWEFIPFKSHEEFPRWNCSFPTLTDSTFDLTDHFRCRFNPFLSNGGRGGGEIDWNVITLIWGIYVEGTRTLKQFRTPSNKLRSSDNVSWLDDNKTVTLSEFWSLCSFDSFEGVRNCFSVRVAYCYLILDSA